MIKVTFGKVLDNLFHDTGIVGNKKPVSQRGTIDKSNFKEITILTAETDVKIRIHDKANIDMTLETYENGPQLKWRHGEENVSIEATAGTGTWQLGLQSLSICLYVAVPIDIAESWNIKTGSGDVIIPKTRTNSFQASLGSGDLELSNLKAQKARLHTTSGDMLVCDVVVDTLQFGTTSGDGELLKVKGHHMTGVSNSGGLKMKDVYSEKLTVRVSSGDISINEAQVHEVILVCTSGDVHADDMTADKAFLQTTSGDVTYTFKNNCSVDGTATSGDMVIICKNKQPHATIQIETSSGDIRTNIPKSILQKSRHRLSGIVGNGEERIQIKTNSGDADLLFR